MTEYRQEDRTMLGEPPWQPTAPALIDWESAHGHDVRLDCSLDGCNVLVAAYEAAVEALERLTNCAYHYGEPRAGRSARWRQPNTPSARMSCRASFQPDGKCSCGIGPAVEQARAALARLRESVPA